MKYCIFLFGGLYEETEIKQDAIDTLHFLIDENGEGSAYMETSNDPIIPKSSFWIDDVVY